MVKRLLPLILTLFIATSVSSAPTVPVAGHVVIVHPSNPIASVSAAELSRMFLKQSTAWPNGWPVLPVDQLGTSAVRESFSQRVLGRSARSVKSHWKQQIFSGRGVPPPERANDGEVLRFVLSNRGAVGYVTAGAAGTAKIIQVR
jgi:ABC-type phosphate transport system substrate-binding protein